MLLPTGQNCLLLFAHPKRFGPRLAVQLFTYKLMCLLIDEVIGLVHVRTLQEDITLEVVPIHITIGQKFRLQRNSN